MRMQALEVLVVKGLVLGVGTHQMVRVVTLTFKPHYSTILVAFDEVESKPNFVA